MASQCVTKHISERVRAAESQGHTFIKLAWDETGLRFRFPLEEMQRLFPALDFKLEDAIGAEAEAAVGNHETETETETEAG